MRYQESTLLNFHNLFLGLVNGCIVHVTGMENSESESITVRYYNSQEQVDKVTQLKKTTFPIYNQESGLVVGLRTQIPVILAYGRTIYKVHKVFWYYNSKHKVMFHCFNIESRINNERS